MMIKLLLSPPPPDKLWKVAWNWSTTIIFIFFPSSFFFFIFICPPPPPPPFLALSLSFFFYSIRIFFSAQWISISWHAIWFYFITPCICKNEALKNNMTQWKLYEQRTYDFVMGFKRTFHSFSFIFFFGFPCIKESYYHIYCTLGLSSECVI